MTAIEAALLGLIDYAGLYPPASLDMAAAVHNYLDYRAGSRALFLGRFIVDAARLGELREAAGGEISQFRLSLIAPATLQPAQLDELRDLRVESIEIKSSDPAAIERLHALLPSALECFVELSLSPLPAASIEALARTGARAKLRMGGVDADKFPTAQSVLAILKALAIHGVPFKATAGLHHPIRSCHRLTYAADSPASTMHGFVNLLCAAAVIHFAGDLAHAEAVLQEENSHAFRISPRSVGWRTLEWSADQLGEVRRRFFLSFGSCSFTEPIQDLEALGWL